MSFIKISTGKFIVLSTVAITPEAKSEIDSLTEGGSLIEAVIATHPFHSLYFESFFQMYPHVKFYGTPRHIRRLTNIPWAGDVSDPSVLSMYESYGIFMRIPAGTEFINPREDNHFTSLFVYHSESRTLSDDDTIMCFENPGCLFRVFGIKPGSVSFHPTPWKDALLPTSEAPIQFKEFFQKLLDDWDFDNLVTAHMGNKIGGAKKALVDMFVKEIPSLDKLATVPKSLVSYTNEDEYHVYISYFDF
jgi:hypothetical protein